MADDPGFKTSEMPSDLGVTRTACGGSIMPDTTLPAIPGYVIVEELGRGGMGVVYRALQESLNRPVALKVLLSGVHAGARDLARFRAEAEAAAAVQHPNVVHVYAIGQHGGLPYMALELVPGGSLAARLAQGPLETESAVRWLRAIARGVQAAHERGVVHRDLKPANVLFSATGEPKVADFGLAKIGDTGLTASGAIMGTPAYMAPEQARGDTKAAGPTADVWALGAMLYECLAGRQPFVGKSAPETLRLVSESDPPMLAGIPKDLTTIVLKCLDKEPNRRYANAGALADDLGRYLAGDAVLARRRGPLAQMARWVGRHKGPVYGLVGALVVAGIVGAFFVPPRSSRSTPEAVAGKNNSFDELVDEPPSNKEGAFGTVQKAAWRMNSSNNLRQLAIGTHNLSSTYDRIPPPAIYDKNGKALLSWRVMYLPFMEEDKLYKQFKLDEPWDSPHNIKLLDQMPKFLTIQGTSPPQGHTYYQLLTGPGTIFDPAHMKPGQPFGKSGLSFAQITDGTANTILMVEAKEAVPWTKPVDVELAPGRPLPAFGGHFAGGFNVAMADGRALFVSDMVSTETLRASITPQGGEPIGSDWPNGARTKVVEKDE